MFKSVLIAISLLATLVAGATSFANEGEESIWICSLKAKLTSDAGQVKHGPAVIKCLTPAGDGQFTMSNVYVEISGAQLEPGLAQESTIFMGTGAVPVSDWKQLLGRQKLEVAFARTGHELRAVGYTQSQDMKVYQNRQAFFQNNLDATTRPALAALVMMTKSAANLQTQP